MLGRFLARAQAALSRKRVEESMPEAVECRTCEYEQLPGDPRSFIPCTICQQWYCPGECYSLHRREAVR